VICMSPVCFFFSISGLLVLVSGVVSCEIGVSI